MYFSFCGTRTMRKPTQLYPSTRGFIQVRGGLLCHSYASTLSKYIYQSAYCANMGWYRAFHRLVTLNPSCTWFCAKIRVRQTGWRSTGTTLLVRIVDLSCWPKVRQLMFMAHLLHRTTCRGSFPSLADGWHHVASSQQHITHFVSLHLHLNDYYT